MRSFVVPAIAGVVLVVSLWSLRSELREISSNWSQKHGRELIEILLDGKIIGTLIMAVVSAVVLVGTALQS